MLAEGLDSPGSPHGVVTFSAGVAAFGSERGDESREQVVRRADTALYAAKAGDRNPAVRAAPPGAQRD